MKEKDSTRSQTGSKPDSPLKRLAQSVRGSVYTESDACPGCGQKMTTPGKPVYLVNAEEDEQGRNHVLGVLVTVVCAKCSRRIQQGTQKQAERVMARLYDALTLATEPPGGEA